MSQGDRGGLQQTLVDAQSFRYLPDSAWPGGNGEIGLGDMEGLSD